MKRFPMPKVYGAVTVGERGQVVIPARIRKAYRIHPGDRLIVLAKEGGPIGFVPVEQFSGFLTHMTEMLAKVKKSAV
jgi:AbrB family looped-hinge helix DNA binding protein